MTFILYNPFARNTTGREIAEEARLKLGGDAELRELPGMNVPAFLAGLSAEDRVILCGGDGTLNHFANDVAGCRYTVPVYLYGAGTGNDFLRDLGDRVRDNMAPLDGYLDRLPTVTINGKETRYVNGIGYGIDGMACEVADAMRAAGKKDINYTSISIKLLLGGYHCPNARIIVDGVEHRFRRVWLASAMNGRYYGGGMKVAPEQDRLSGQLTCVVLHGSGKLKTLMVFPGIFQGKHVKHTEMTTVLTGKEIVVEFDRPMALQIDGDTVSGVTSYTAKMPASVPAEAVL